MIIQEKHKTVNQLASRILSYVAVYGDKNGRVPINKLLSISQNKELITSATLMLNNRGYLSINDEYVVISEKKTLVPDALKNGTGLTDDCDGRK